MCDAEHERRGWEACVGSSAIFALVGTLATGSLVISLDPICFPQENITDFTVFSLFRALRPEVRTPRHMPRSPRLKRVGDANLLPSRAITHHKSNFLPFSFSLPQNHRFYIQCFRRLPQTPSPLTKTTLQPSRRTKNTLLSLRKCRVW